MRRIASHGVASKTPGAGSGKRPRLRRHGRHSGSGGRGGQPTGPGGWWSAQLRSRESIPNGVPASSPDVGAATTGCGGVNGGYPLMTKAR